MPDILFVVSNDDVVLQQDGTPRRISIAIFLCFHFYHYFICFIVQKTSAFRFYSVTINMHSFLVKLQSFRRFIVESHKPILCVENVVFYDVMKLWAHFKLTGLEQQWLTFVTHQTVIICQTLATLWSFMSQKRNNFCYLIIKSLFFPFIYRFNTLVLLLFFSPTHNSLRSL